MDNLPEISLGTAALIIFGICTIYMVFRGLARMIVNTLCLTLSAWVGFWMWQQAPSLAIDWIGQPSQLITTGLPVVSFLAMLFLSRRIVGFFRAPIPRPMEEVRPHTSKQFFSRLIVTLIPAALICLIGATLIHHVTSVSEIREYVESDRSNPSAPSRSEKLKETLSSAIPSKIMDWLDPLTTESRMKLAKLIAASQSKPLEPVIDPATGEPYPRAIIVDDPELLKLAKEGRFSTLLRHPLLTEALEDPKIRQALGLPQ
ncbi:MAG: hypothetical protein AB8D78_05640 [Akkermansiaceae bacterium]